MVEAREEPVGPDGAVGQVAEDGVGFAAAQGLLGRRQVDRAEVVDPGQRVAGVDEVAQVPVAAAGQGGEAGDRSERRAALPSRRDHGQARGRAPPPAAGS